MDLETGAGRAEILQAGVPASSSSDESEIPSFDEFYRREMPRLVTLAGGLCGAAIAEDVAQEAMLVAFRRWGEVGRGDHAEAWVRRVCANMAVSQFRRRTIEVRALLRTARRPAPPELPATHEAFWAQLRRLPRRQAQAAALRYVYELSVHDIAETLGCSEGTVKAHLSRARHALVGQLDLDGER